METLSRYSDSTILVYTRLSARETQDKMGTFEVKHTNSTRRPRPALELVAGQTWHSNGALCDPVAIESERWSASGHVLRGAGAAEFAGNTIVDQSLRLREQLEIL
jgi:hypothetical protein